MNVDPVRFIAVRGFGDDIRSNLMAADVIGLIIRGAVERIGSGGAFRGIIDSR